MRIKNISLAVKHILTYTNTFMVIAVNGLIFLTIVKIMISKRIEVISTVIYHLCNIFAASKNISAVVAYAEP